MKFVGIISSILACFLLQLSLFDVTKADVCLMLYQMADNDLEYFIRQDNNELIQSPAIRDSTLTTWVYFDSRNYGTSEDITAPLEDVFNPDGTPLEEKSEGSLYMKWDHSQEKMVVDVISTTELNGDDPQTLHDFLTYAMSDCVARGSTEYMLILSSHGSGMFGFGGDENTRRRLTQANQNIVTAVQAAIETVEGAPDKLDVLGFDACLMQAVDALDEYRNITRYYLASEAIEPGHGWAYNFLEPAATALEYATNLHDNFLQQTHGVDYHLTPKTMAIVATDKFTSFLDAWDALFAELNSQILTDKNVHTITQRARLNSLAFMGGTDTSNTKTPSAMDIGSFFETFRTLCSIDPNSKLELLQQAAETAYAEMFVSRGVGPGTPPASGMHILWPQRRVYEQEDLYHILLSDTSIVSTGDAPNWINFLLSFYEAPAPEDTSENSVCLQSVVSVLELEAEDSSLLSLLLNPAVVPLNNAVVASSYVTVGTDEIYVRYGVDLSLLLDSRFRHLQEVTPPTLNSRNHKSFYDPLKSHAENARRRLQPENMDYFILFGGDVLGAFDGPAFSASWDKNFFLLGNSDSVEQVFASDAGGGLKNIPVMYFARDNPISAEDIPVGTTIEAAVALGGMFGFLTVSIDDTVDSVIHSFVLYTFDKQTGAISETPRSAGGQIAPVLFAELVVGDVVLSELVGGFGKTIFPVTEATDLEVFVIDAVTWIDSFDEIDSVVVDIAAFDNDRDDGFDFFRTLVPYDHLPGPPFPVPPSVGPPFSEPVAEPPIGHGSSSGSPTNFLMSSVVISVFVLMVELLL